MKYCLKCWKSEALFIVAPFSRKSIVEDSFKSQKTFFSVRNYYLPEISVFNFYGLSFSTQTRYCGKHMINPFINIFLTWTCYSLHYHTFFCKIQMVCTSLPPKFDDKLLFRLGALNLIDYDLKLNQNKYSCDVQIFFISQFQRMESLHYWNKRFPYLLNEPRTHTHAHTHTYIYIYMCVCVCVCACACKI